jgi:hypothetical protein
VIIAVIICNWNEGSGTEVENDNLNLI